MHREVLLGVGTFLGKGYRHRLPNDQCPWETITSKPAFRAALKQRRCLIPANGFYEWKGRAGNKQPYYFHLPSGEPMKNNNV
jgi:hypothetical protein